MLDPAAAPLWLAELAERALRRLLGVFGVLCLVGGLLFS